MTVRMAAASITRFTTILLYTHFSDVDFVYGRALAQTGGMT